MDIKEFVFKHVDSWQEHAKKINDDPEYKKKFIEARDQNILDYWNELKPFKSENDVPSLPRMNSFYTNKLIELGAIPKSKLVDGTWYYGNYRNSNIAMWDSSSNKFKLWRYKFGFFIDMCNHFEDDNGYALFVPLRKAYDSEINSEDNNYGKSVLG